MPTTTAARWYYLLFDVSATMAEVDRRGDRYESIPFVRSFLQEGDILWVYAFSDEILPFTYADDGLLPPETHEDFSLFQGRPIITNTEQLKRTIEQAYKKHGGKDGIYFVNKYTRATPSTQVGQDIDELKQRKDEGWFTDISHVLNTIFYSHMKGRREVHHHIIVVTDGRPDPFPDFSKENGFTYQKRLALFKEAEPDPNSFNSLDSKFAKVGQMNKYKLDVHLLRMQRLLRELENYTYHMSFISYKPKKDRDQVIAREFFEPIDSQRIEHEFLAAGSPVYKRVNMSLLKNQRKVNFNELRTIQLKEAEVKGNYLRITDDFDVPRMPLKSLTFDFEWNEGPSCDRSIFDKDFSFEVKFASSKRDYEYVVYSGREPQSRLVKQRWSGSGVRFNIADPVPGNWLLTAQIPKADIAKECFAFDLKIYGSYPSLGGPLKLQWGSKNKKCADRNDIFIEIDGSAVVQRVSAPLDIKLMGLTPGPSAEPGRDYKRMRPPKNFQLLKSGPSNHYYLCLPPNFKNGGERIQLRTGGYTLRITYKDNGNKIERSVHQDMDVSIVN